MCIEYVSSVDGICVLLCIVRGRTFYEALFPKSSLIVTDIVRGRVLAFVYLYAAWLIHDSHTSPVDGSRRKLIYEQEYSKYASSDTDLCVLIN